MRLSLNTRRDIYDQESEKIHVALVTIDHPDLDAPIRVSGDDTMRLTDDPTRINPERYGTISNGIEYENVIMSWERPGDEKDATPSFTLVFDNVPGMTRLLRSFLYPPATASLVVVFADAPDLEIDRHDGYEMVAVESDEASVRFTLTQEGIEDEPCGETMSWDKCPALFDL
jgi:hypothetical protein